MKRKFTSKDQTHSITVETEIKTRSGKDFTNPSRIIEGYAISISGSNPFGGSWGQIFDDVNPNEYQNSSDLSEIIKIWKRWHLTDLHAGTKRQTDALHNWSGRKEGWSYDEDCNYLKSIGLLNDNGYSYGNAWLFEPVPRPVVDRLRRLMGE